MNNDFDTNLDILNLLTDALTSPLTIDEALNRITAITCRLMDTEQAVFLFREEERRELVVRSVVGVDSPNVRAGHALVVPPRLHSILWQQRTLHQINWIYSGIDDIMFPIISVPVLVKGARIGLLLAGGARDKNAAKPYDQARRKIFTLLSRFASLVIENSKVYDYLRQHFAATSRELREQNKLEAESRSRGEAEQLMVTSIKNPSKVVRLLTESFFKELAHAGFTAGHVATAAAHLLQLVTESDIDPTGRLLPPGATSQR